MPPLRRSPRFACPLLSLDFDVLCEGLVPHLTHAQTLVVMQTCRTMCILLFCANSLAHNDDFKRFHALVKDASNMEYLQIEKGALAGVNASWREGLKHVEAKAVFLLQSRDLFAKLHTNIYVNPRWRTDKRLLQIVLRGLVGSNERHRTLQSGFWSWQRRIEDLKRMEHEWITEGRPLD